ncbi:MAG: HlyD family efflux transporter periplasmic adaptor subunit [Lachnospiraceae bacterium]|nr:HlyD family efflux transporter periplasmic adaptor subunit [Lachnospiraceae bacterium]
MNEKTTKRREWIKNAAIVFLVILLALTFFSNTIMNYSLPEVATVFVQPGSIASRVRGTGTVVATDPYNVIAAEGRVIASVAVRVGEEVERDDVIYLLEEGDSEELKKAEQELVAMELSFNQQLFAAGVSPEVIQKVVSGEFRSFDDFRDQITSLGSRVEASTKSIEALKIAEEVVHRRLVSLGVASGSQVALKDELLIELENYANHVLRSVNSILQSYDPRFAGFISFENALEETRTLAALNKYFDMGKVTNEQHEASFKSYIFLRDQYANREKALNNAIEIAQNELVLATIALADAERRHETLKEAYGNATGNIMDELNFANQVDKLDAKKDEIVKLKESAVGGAVLAPVAGVITSLSLAAGETMKKEDTIAVIRPAGRGFTTSFSVSNEQASRVQVGDPAEVTSGWWWSDLSVVLSAIMPDPANPGQNRLLVFTVTGSDVQPGQQLNLSVGQRSANFELTVPNSAVREDSNGKFILIVETRSTPLSNRYYASRVDVTVLAEDDNNSAISAGIFPYEYTITTATKPVVAGTQIRLSN